MSRSDLRKAAALLPGLYFLQSRVSGFRDLIFLVATSFVPAWWLLIRVGGLEPVEAAAVFGAGYLAFIAAYELGYLANDVIDARKPGGRDRWKYAAGGIFVGLFLIIRALTWTAIGVATGWIGNIGWLLGYAMLGIVFTLHNVIQAKALRSTTFVQLALLRFSLPILAAFAPGQMPLVLLLAMLLYVYLRWLAYLDSKDLLQMPGRKDPLFALSQMALLLPILLLVAWLTRNSVALELWLWFMLLYLARALVDRRSKQEG